MSVIGSVIFQMQWRSYDILSDNLLLPYLKRNKSTATCNFVYRLIMNMFFQASFISKTMENMYQTRPSWGCKLNWNLLIFKILTKFLTRPVHDIMKLLDAFRGITTSITLLFQKVVIKDALYIFSVTFIIKNSPFFTPHIT